MEKDYNISNNRQPQSNRPDTSSNQKSSSGGPTGSRKVQVGIIAAAVIIVLISVAYSMRIIGGPSEKRVGYPITRGRRTVRMIPTRAIQVKPRAAQSKTRSEQVDTVRIEPGAPNLEPVVRFCPSTYLRFPSQCIQAGVAPRRS